MTDYGSDYADRRQAIIEWRLLRIYREAQKDLFRKADQYARTFARQEREMLRRVNAGTMTEQDFRDWRMRKEFVGERWTAKVQSMTGALLDYNNRALDIIRGEQYNVFAENANYQAYCHEKDFSGGISFDIYDETTVERLIREKPELLPRKIINGRKDKAWNQGIIANSITQGILQGESIPDIARRIARDTTERNSKAMVRYARTAMTAAQNAGRLETMHRAQDMGIKVKKVWMATLDDRTRDAHAELDGESVNIDEPFVNELGEIDYPGDPGADGDNTWNCRCTLGYEYPDYSNMAEQENNVRYDQTYDEEIENMSYDEWKEMRAEKQSYASRYKDLTSEEAYNEIWGNIVDERTLSEYEEELTASQRQVLNDLMEKNKHNAEKLFGKNVSKEDYWKALLDGMCVDEEVNKLLLDIKNAEETALKTLDNSQNPNEEKYNSPTQSLWKNSKYESDHVAIEKATDVESVAQLLGETGVFTSKNKVNFKGIDLQNAKDIAHAYINMTEKYPWMRRKVGFISSAKLESNTNAEFTREIKGSYKGTKVTNKILFNKTIFGIRKESNIVQIAGMYHPIGTGNVASTLHHEYAHAMVYTIATKLGVDPNVLAARIADRAFARFGMPKTLGNTQYNLSGYAAESDQELIAEASSEYHTSQSPRELAKIIMDELLKEAKGAGLK